MPGTQLAAESALAGAPGEIRILPVVGTLFAKGMHQKINEGAHFGLGETARRINRIDALRFHRQFGDDVLDQPLRIASA